MKLVNENILASSQGSQNFKDTQPEVLKNLHTKFKHFLDMFWTSIGGQNRVFQKVVGKFGVHFGIIRGGETCTCSKQIQVVHNDPLMSFQ